MSTLHIDGKTESITRLDPMNTHLKTDAAQQAWLFEAERKFSKEHQPNPCVRMYGPREGRQCKECRLLRRKQFNGKTYFKCFYRGDTRSEATDHRAGWDACAKFVPGGQRERITAGQNRRKD